MHDIKIITETDYFMWEDYLKDAPSANFSHRIGWLKAVQRTYGHRPFYLMALRQGRACGILPLFLVSNPIAGRVLASDIFASYGGVCAEDPDVEMALLNEAVSLSISLRASYLEIKNASKIDNPTHQWKTKTSYCTMVLDLTPGSESIWKDWKKNTRWNIRKAIKSGLQVEHGHHLLEDYYHLVALNMKRLGTPIHSKKFYENILREFPTESTLFVTRAHGRAVAGALTLHTKGYCHIYLSASDSHFWHLRPNDLLYWEIIKYVAKEGFKYLDFGRSSWKSGTFDFKQHFGARPLMLHYIYYLNRCKTVPYIHQDNKRYRLASKVWQHLPMLVANTLGPHLIRYVV